MSPRGIGQEFQFSIHVSSQKAPDKSGLIKLGCFPKIVPPSKEMLPDELGGAMPLIPESDPNKYSSIELYTLGYLTKDLAH